MSEGWDSLNDDGDDDVDNPAKEELLREAAIFAACFSTPEGQKALELLREKTYGRNGRDLLDFSDVALMNSYMVHRDGQCSVMRMIDNYIGITMGRIKVE